MAEARTDEPVSANEQAVIFAHACWREGKNPKEVLQYAMRAMVSPDNDGEASEILRRLAPLMHEDGVTFGDIAGRSRIAPINRWRTIAIWALRIHTDLTVMRIGALLNRHHTSVVHAAEVGRRNVHDTPGLLDRINQHLNT